VVTFGGTGSGPGELQDPKDVDVDGGECVWVADGVSGKVIQFDLFGNYLAGYFLGDGVDVRGVAADENVVWIAAKDRLGYLDQRGKLQWCFGKDDLRDMQLASVDDVAIARDGLVVLDAVGGKVAWFTVERKATR
jgi:hypothetical protein